MNEESTTRKHLKPPWVPQSLPKPKNLNLLFKKCLRQISESITVGLDACQIAVDTPFCQGLSLDLKPILLYYLFYRVFKPSCISWSYSISR